MEILGRYELLDLLLLGDCELLAGHPRRALSAYGRGLRDGLERRVTIDTAFQGEGIVAALVDLGRHDDALEALGAVDQFTRPGGHPREQVPYWAAMLGHRLARARAAPGPADAAYERGAAHGLDGAAAVLLRLSDPT